MALDTIYVIRHGVKPKWIIDPGTNKYAPIVDAPSGEPFDPPLTDVGKEQARELARHLVGLEPPIERFYSSTFYRCLETIEPTIEALSSSTTDASILKVRGEPGLRDWYTNSSFKNPRPAGPQVLGSLFPFFDTGYAPIANPPDQGENVESFHKRIAMTMQNIIAQSDREGTKTVLISTHASALVAIGRVLTGCMPADMEEEDFKAFPCGLSTFTRKNLLQQTVVGHETLSPPTGSWETSERGQQYQLGIWKCTTNSDCSFLKPRGLPSWRFSKDEYLIDRMFHRDTASNCGPGQEIQPDGERLDSSTSDQSLVRRLSIY